MTSKAAALTEQEREQIVEAIYQGRVRGCREKVENWGPAEDEAESHSLLLRILRGESEVFVANALPVIESILAARLADSRPAVTEAAVEAAAEEISDALGFSEAMRIEQAPVIARAALSAALPHMGDGKADSEHSEARKALSFAAYTFALNHPLYGPDTTQAVMDWLNAFKDEHYPPRLSPTGDDRKADHNQRGGSECRT